MRASAIASIARAAALLGCLVPPAGAQALGYSWGAIVPVLAQTGSYQSSIYIHSPSTAPISVTPTYTGALGSATAGKVECPPIAVSVDSVFASSLAALCPALNPGTNFGGLELQGSGSEITAYTRAETPAGNGFSVEGFEIDTFYCGTRTRTVTGLVRQEAPPTYQSNCFLWNRLEQPARIVITLLAGNGSLLADDIVDVASGTFVRMLDIFAALGSPPGDYGNVRVTFESIVPIGGGTPTDVVAFCTVQNNSTFDADFRMSKCQPWY
jgi:hypothetical protein